MSDMLVKLYELPDDAFILARLKDEGIKISRAMAPDKFRVLPWVKEQAGLSAAGECDVSFSNKPVSCFIATVDTDIIGYACYDATCKNFFGPTLVSDAYRGKGLGKALLLRCLRAMFAEGYAYAIIGGVGPAKFYERCVGAFIIPGSAPGIYTDFLGRKQ